MKCLFVFFVALFGSQLLADPINEQHSKKPQKVILNIKGAVDRPEFTSLINAFEARYPGVQVNYQEYSTRQLYVRFIAGDLGPADLITSSAMDLQIKLVNDGYAQQHQSVHTQALPEWGKWRDEIFGFTYEPAVIAYNHDFISHNSSIVAPNMDSRDQMLDYIRSNPERIKGKIGTFDIVTGGLGYLLWSHDSQQSTSYGRVLESFSIHDVRLYRSSADMLKALGTGEIAIAYNLLGSYAKYWAKRYPQIEVILPKDYTMAIMRTAFIPKTAENANIAKVFLDFLLSEQGQRILADETNLYPINEALRQQPLSRSSELFSTSSVRPISLGLKLLVLSDGMKRNIILDEWSRALRK